LIWVRHGSISDERYSGYTGTMATHVVQQGQQLRRASHPGRERKLTAGSRQTVMISPNNPTNSSSDAPTQNYWREVVANDRVVKLARQLVNYTEQVLIAALECDERAAMYLDKIRGLGGHDRKLTDNTRAGVSSSRVSDTLHGDPSENGQVSSPTYAKHVGFESPLKTRLLSRKMHQWESTISSTSSDPPILIEESTPLSPPKYHNLRTRA